jgi:hypothetical protein
MQSEMSDETRHFYHSFPRPRTGETRSDVVERGLAILRSIARSGLILAPEIVEWKTPVSIGSRSPIRLLQQRACFTELSLKDLPDHAARFGPFGLEFDILALRRAGALPVIYMPQSLTEHDHLALLGPIIVSHLGHIKYLLEQLSGLAQLGDPEHIKKNFLGATHIADNCVLTLTNGDAARGTVQTFQVPWSTIRDFLSYVGFENAPFAAMSGVASITQSLFYPTDDEHVDERLGYYRQREWRVTAGYFVNDTPRGRNLTADEKSELLKIDGRFWQRELTDDQGAFRRLDRAVALTQPNSDELLGMATRLIVPREALDEVRKLFKGPVSEAAW